ncbi:MAG: DUF4350 domain-containing protein [Acidimicrobiales bacterium]
MAVHRRRPPRSVVIGACIGASLLAVALVGGRPGRDGPPLDPRSDGPLGTSALVALLRAVGADVDLSVGLPGLGDDIALVLQDRLQPGQVEDLIRWVEEGGTLVVTDPSSWFAPPLAQRGLGAELGLDDGEIAPGTCTIEALAPIGDVDGGSAPRFATIGEASCFGDERGAFVATESRGAGEVVAVAGAAFATNELLGRADNAVLATTLLAPMSNTTVRFVDPPIPAGGGDKTLGELVPSGVKRALVQLAVAFVLYAAWRAIRVGQPVAEDLPVEVASSDLVAAIGRLLARTDDPESVAEMLRANVRRVLRARLGVPNDAPAGGLIEVAAARTGLSEEQVRVALDERPVTNEAELVAVAQAVASMQQEVPQ